MASEQQVKRYLAYWFQLGKKVMIHSSGAAVSPPSVVAGDRYSDEFEAVWLQIVSPESGDCYLEGTQQTIAELLSPRWEIEPCVRCDMPVPLIKIGLPPELCPCNDLPSWPNTEIPKPREPVSSQDRLKQIRDRLSQSNNKQGFREEVTPPSPESSIPHNGTFGQGRLSEIRQRLTRSNGHRESGEDLSISPAAESQASHQAIPIGRSGESLDA
ncbi:MAG TPA: hypothetical protein V6D11_01080 [Waterburya sp.]|jgi:hypothetical protein